MENFQSDICDCSFCVIGLLLLDDFELLCLSFTSTTPCGGLIALFHQTIPIRLLGGSRNLPVKNDLVLINSYLMFTILIYYVALDKFSPLLQTAS